jgi:hypothetical protein
MGQAISTKKIAVKKGMQVSMKDTLFITKKDTVLQLSEKESANIKIVKDPHKKSSAFYKKLERKSSKSKITEGLFDLIVTDNKKPDRTEFQKSEDPFKKYQGYIIGSIVHRSVNILEGSVTDTLQVATSKLGIFINRVHRDTRSFIIAKNLTIDVGEEVNPYKLADNERLLRQLVVIKDARIYLKPSSKLPNTVDVIVVTQDVGSLGVRGGYSSPHNFYFGVYDINILGYAKQLQLSYFWNSKESPNNGYGIILREPNILKSYLQGEVEYQNNYLRNQVRLNVGRDFFTPDIKYAGGIELYRTKENYLFEDYDTLKVQYSENYSDLWAGRSFQLKSRLNLIFSTRLNTRHFIDRPFVEIDSNAYFHNKTIGFTSITLTKRNFMTGNRIRGFGKTEDIPIGASATILVGKQFDEFQDRKYFEVNGNIGRYFKSIGYFNFSLATGTFFRGSEPQDGLLKITGRYFSNLNKFHKTEVRQFVNLSYTKGINRITDQTLTIDGKWRNEVGRVPLGNERLTMGLETVYFMPWYVYGFKWALFHRVGVNVISRDEKLFNSASTFAMVGAGIRTLNENLVLPTFSIELNYYAKNKSFNSGFEIKFLTTLPNLYNTNQNYKPQVSEFN